MKTTKAVLLCIGLLLMISCGENDSLQDQYTHLKDPATSMSMDFKSSDHNPDYSTFVDVPPDYWAQEIADENPIKVYIHYYNIAIVLAESGSAENGIYIHASYSSYLPQNMDGITFTEIEQGIYSFLKEK